MPKQPSNKKSSLKTLLIILGFVVVIFVLVMFVGKGGNKGSGTGLVTRTATGDARATPGVLADEAIFDRRSDELVALLRSVSSIDLDDSVFLHPAFGRLKSISEPLPTDRNPGRPNPFLPIGHDTLSSAGLVNRSSGSIGSTATQAPEDTTGNSVATGNDALSQFVGAPTAGE